MISFAGLLSSDKFSRAQLFSFFQRVLELDKERNKRAWADRKNIKTLAPIGLLAFFEASTRTKLSFEKAGLDLGIRWIDLNAKASSLEKGETFEETFKTLSLYEPDFFVVRSASSGFAHMVHHWSNKPVINAGDGQRDHPTQGLLDAFTLWEIDSKKKWKLCFFGDVLRSRVARADILIFRELGFSLSVVDDDTVETRLFASAFKLTLVKRSELKKFDAVICLRVQKERGSKSVLEPLSKTELRDSTLVMHPGPVMIGSDMAHDLCDFDSDRSLVHRQVANGIKVRRALLSDLCSGLSQARGDHAAKKSEVKK